MKLISDMKNILKESNKLEKRPTAFCSYMTSGYIEKCLLRAFRVQRKHNMCFENHKEGDLHMYGECFDEDVTAILQPAHSSASCTMTTVPKIPMLIGEETLVLKFAVLRKEK